VRFTINYGGKWATSGWRGDGSLYASDVANLSSNSLIFSPNYNIINYADYGIPTIANGRMLDLENSTFVPSPERWINGGWGYLIFYRPPGDVTSNLTLIVESPFENGLWSAGSICELFSSIPCELSAQSNYSHYVVNPGIESDPTSTYISWYHYADDCIFYYSPIMVLNMSKGWVGDYPFGSYGSSVLSNAPNGTDDARLSVYTDWMLAGYFSNECLSNLINTTFIPSKIINSYYHPITGFYWESQGTDENNSNCCDYTLKFGFTPP
jgi:hypothetical protein